MKNFKCKQHCTNTGYNIQTSYVYWELKRVSKKRWETADVFAESFLVSSILNQKFPCTSSLVKEGDVTLDINNYKVQEMDWQNTDD